MWIEAIMTVQVYIIRLKITLWIDWHEPMFKILTFSGPSLQTDGVRIYIITKSPSGKAPEAVWIWNKCDFPEVRSWRLRACGFLETTCDFNILQMMALTSRCLLRQRDELQQTCQSHPSKDDGKHWFFSDKQKPFFSWLLIEMIESWAAWKPFFLTYLKSYLK